MLMLLPRIVRTDRIGEFSSTMIAFDTGAVVPAVSFCPIATN